MSNLSGRLTNAETNSELIDVMKDLEAHAKDNPERASGFAYYLTELLTNPSSSVRKSAFNSALAVISTNTGASKDLVAAYRCAMLSPDREVSRQAVSYLPQFVAASLENANSLIKAALEAITRHPGSNDMHVHLSQTMDVVKNISNKTSTK